MMCGLALRGMVGFGDKTGYPRGLSSFSLSTSVSE
jgi:hypothetical protein